MKCPKCQFDNREGAKFCKECGIKLEFPCPSCGHPYQQGSKFCDECGHNLTQPSESIPKELSFDEKLEKVQKYLPGGLTEKILSQRGKIEGERKQVTVMFADMEGFTPLVEKLGPEKAYAIMDAVYEILIHKVHDYGGTVKRYMGDILLNIDDQHINESEAWIKKAIEADELYGMKWNLGRDYALYAKLFKRKGHQTKAKENLSRAIEILTECGADGWVKKYEKELAALS